MSTQYCEAVYCPTSGKLLSLIKTEARLNGIKSSKAILTICDHWLKRLSCPAIIGFQPLWGVPEPIIVPLKEAKRLVYLSTNRNRGDNSNLVLERPRTVSECIVAMRVAWPGWRSFLTSEELGKYFMDRLNSMSLYPILLIPRLYASDSPYPQLRITLVSYSTAKKLVHQGKTKKIKKKEKEKEFRPFYSNEKAEAHFLRDGSTVRLRYFRKGVPVHDIDLGRKTYYFINKVMREGGRPLKPENLLREDIHIILEKIEEWGHKGIATTAINQAAIKTIEQNKKLRKPSKENIKRDIIEDLTKDPNLWKLLND